jgi:DNA-directed RNA polymerase specialized sigma24 family protein
MVDLIWSYSKRTDAVKRVKRTRALLDKRWPVRPTTVVSRPQKLARRLDAETVRAVVEAYEAGSTSRQLAEQFGLARNSVLTLLRKQGVSIRYPRLTAEQCAEIVRLYESGLSQVEIAHRFGCDPGNVWHVLERAGLKGMNRGS